MSGRHIILEYFFGSRVTYLEIVHAVDQYHGSTRSFFFIQGLASLASSINHEEVQVNEDDDAGLGACA